MKNILECNYRKSDGTVRPVQMLVLENSVDAYQGIDLTQLGEEQKKNLLEAHEKFNAEIKKSMKGFKKFKKSGVIPK